MSPHLRCLFEAIPGSGCSEADTSCQCANTNLQDKTSMCLVANCTMQETLDMARLTAATCGFSNESQSTRIIIAVSFFFGGTAVFVMLRTLSKLMTRTLYAEDHIITAAVTLAMAPFVCVIYMAVLGFGSHLWSLKDGAKLQILRLFYISEIIYVVVLALIKVSIVTMYLRIFWAYRPFYLTCYVVLTFIILSSSIITILTILSCRPVEYFWDRDIAGGACLDITALAYANSGLAVVQDLIIVLLPIIMLWRLQMTRKKKFFIGIMFALGGIGLIATIVRLQTLKNFGTTLDPTWTYVPVVYWTSVELSAGIIASCLPAVRILLERFFKFFALSAAGSEPSTFIRLQRQRKSSRKGSAPAIEPWTDDNASQTRLTSSKTSESAASSIVRDGEPAGAGTEGRTGQG
ncbi:hypothetical protein J7T55_013820 [Diaporthe amygdali]|uniref:uncharacterized protein n=1 Tax=Phomopsis amygdali TaxID=1214568 RepID=UPI0022FF2965|nr:uncharacterized protein J7T55_013820 [Diaporthe amygdali]KAJ0119617.1 hypothetical protein J7T55_013820 [Diaporthe amygdali]